MDLILSVRVYGVLINDQNEVLVSDEYIRGEYYTKFPGGGLEIGEGTRECLQREFKEEMNLEVAIGDHIYTTDFFQKVPSIRRTRYYPFIILPEPWKTLRCRSEQPICF
jgi:ADP-ribose pyrophosphatase YjhB (NUDIX family)